MQEIQYTLRESLRPYVNCILTDSSTDAGGSLHMPLYADGYPGLMYQQSPRGFYLLPRDKKLSALFLYGQTVHPVALRAQGTYTFVVFQLYPFASQYLLNVDPKVLNDDCYDLLELKSTAVPGFFDQLTKAHQLDERIEIMSEMVEDLIATHRVPADDRVQQAIELIIQSRGQVKMSEVQDQVFITERTLERHFLRQVGLRPKQFASIIQFQSSLERLDTFSFDKLTEVGLESGFADQSHFIRVFKKYTGLSPSQYLKQVSGRD